MPLTKKGEEILHTMQKEYGPKKGESVFYASINKGTIEGAEKDSADPLEAAQDVARRLAKATMTDSDEDEVIYADDGCQADKIKRFPVARRDGAVDPGAIEYAWDYIHNPLNKGKYRGQDLIDIRKKIEQASMKAAQK